jgi:N-acetylglucosaminyl-diphospho-decaprenol L-rhamnosyltransferase
MYQIMLALGVVLYKTRPEQLERLTRSLVAAKPRVAALGFTVQWLDNSPTRALEAQVSALGAYQHAGANLGFGAGHNRLMARAFSDPAVRAYVCLNPDAVLHPRCLPELVNALARHRRCGLIEARQFPDEHPKEYDPSTHETPWASGCALLITRELYEAVGGFDERFFMYCEDVDLSWRARAAGFAVAIAPDALVHHYVDGRASNPENDRNLHRSALLLAEKYGDGPFAQEQARHLEALGVSPTRGPLSRKARAFARVVDFAHGFHFARARW